MQKCLYIDKLVELGSKALSDENEIIIKNVISNENLMQLRYLLARKNGFYAFNASLHVFSSGVESLNEKSLEEWNSETLWRRNYGDMVLNCFFFAEDLFGGQFCFKGDEVYSFDPETGGLSYMSSTLDEWAKKIVEDSAVLTGYEVGYEWQKRNGVLTTGKRLMPKVPFVCGGEYSLDNLVQIDSVESMRLRGDFAQQIRDLPDGKKIRIKFVE